MAASHAPPSILLLLLFYTTLALSQQTGIFNGTGNSTVLKQLPGSEVVCSTTNWYDIVWFYFANYFMHALSVRSLPGENTITSFMFKFACLLIPFTGIRRGLCLISRSSNLVRNDLQSAARANALCMIVRGVKWKPREGDEIDGCRVEVIADDEEPGSSQESRTEEGSDSEGKAEDDEKPWSPASKDRSEIAVARQDTMETVTRSATNESREKDLAGGKVEDVTTPISPIRRLKSVLTGSTLTPSIAPDTDDVKPGKGSRKFKPMSKIKEKSTQKTPEPEDARTGDKRVTIKMKDFYRPLPATNTLVKLYKIFVESYKFGRSSLNDSIRLDPRYTKVHGLCNLADGYELTFVPPDIKVLTRGIPPDRPNLLTSIRNRDTHNVSKALTSHTRLASTQNAPRILFSLFQTVSAGWSLYRAQGIQIEQFGYAAYGLTVLPYMIVSVINFIGSFLTKEYDMVYLVHSEIMDEMVARGGSVDGVVGSVDPSPEDLAEPTIPTESAQGIRAKVQGGVQELLTPGGETLQFRVEEPTHEEPIPSGPLAASDPTPAHLESENEPSATLTYRASPTSSISSSDTSPSWCEPLELCTPWRPKPPPYDPIVPNQHNWRECRRRWHMLFHHRDPYAEHLPASLTVLHIPCHGPLIRSPAPIYEPFIQVSTLALLIVSVAAPFVVITILTGWKEAHSETRDRNFVLNWLICGITLGYAVGSVERLQGNKAVARAGAVVLVSYGTYCISGFVMVAQQMMKIGKCEPL